MLILILISAIQVTSYSDFSLSCSVGGFETVGILKLTDFGNGNSGISSSEIEFIMNY